MNIRPARPGEEAELTELAIRSKGHWGHDAEPFYLRFGAERIGTRVSSATGRELPLLRISAPAARRGE